MWVAPSGLADTCFGLLLSYPYRIDSFDLRPEKTIGCERTSEDLARRSFLHIDREIALSLFHVLYPPHTYLSLKRSSSISPLIVHRAALSEHITIANTAQIQLPSGSHEDPFLCCRLAKHRSFRMNPLTSSASGARSADPTCATKRISGFEVGEQTASSASERHLLLADYIPVASPSRAPNTSYSSSELYSSYPTGMLSSPMRFNSDSLVPTLEHALHSPALSKSNSAPMPPPALLSRSQVRRDGSASSFDGGLDILGQSVDDPYEEPPTARRGQGHHYSHSVPNFSAGFPSYTSSGGISNYLMPPHSAASTSSAYSASSSAHQESFADMTFSLPPSLVSSSGKSQPAAIRNRGMRRSSSSQSSASTQIPTSRLAQASPILGQGAGSSQRRPSAPAEMHFTFPGVQHAMPHMQHQQSTESDFLSMCGSMTSDTASAFGSPPQPAPRQFSATAMSKNMQPINTGQFMPSSAPASAVSFGGDSLAGDDDAHLTANEKKRKRRVAHNMVERKRRDGKGILLESLSPVV